MKPQFITLEMVSPTSKFTRNVSIACTQIVAVADATVPKDGSYVWVNDVNGEPFEVVEPRERIVKYLILGEWT